MKDLSSLFSTVMVVIPRRDSTVLIKFIITCYIYSERMQQLDEVIRNRRSIRRFEKQAEEAEKLEALLEAARWAQ
jgi:hypothetical protein